MYMHLIKQVEIDGKPHYRIVKRYQSFANLQRYLFQTGDDVWVLTTAKPDYFDEFSAIGHPLGSRWHHGGFVTERMPVLPLVK